MRTYARLRVDLWRDDEWRTLSPLSQWLYIVILTSRRLDLAGCLLLHRATLRHLAAGLEDRDIDEALKELDHARFICVDADTDELVVRTFVRHDLFGRQEKLPHTLGKGMWSAWSAIESEALRQAVVDNLPDQAWDPKFNPPDEARGMRQ